MIRRFVERFMLGRYGADQLGVVLFTVSAVLYIVASVFGLRFLRMAAWFVLFFAMFRFLSHNITRRRAENDRFLTVFWPKKRRFQQKFGDFKERKQYKFFKCPACGNRLRVPRGKGRIRITCPKCGERFERKT